MFCNIPLLALLIAGQPVATHRLFNLLRHRIKHQRSKQNRKIFILRLLFFVSPLRYTQSRDSARALFRLCNQRLLRSLHFRFAHNGGGIMLRNLLALLIAGQPVATHRLFLRPRIKRQRSKQNRKIFILRLLFFVSPLRYTQSRGFARAKKKRLIQVVGKSIGKKGKESLFLKQYNIFQVFIILRFSLYLLFIFFVYYALNVLNEDSTFLDITFLTASISVEIAFCSVSSCLSFNSKFLS